MIINNFTLTNESKLVTAELCNTYHNTMSPNKMGIIVFFILIVMILFFRIYQDDLIHRIMALLLLVSSIMLANQYESFIRMEMYQTGANFFMFKILLWSIGIGLLALIGFEIDKFLARRKAKKEKI